MLIQSPLIRVPHRKSSIRQDDLDRPQFMGTRHSYRLLVVGFVPAAVGYHQFLTRLAPGVDHVLALRRGIRHGLFRQNMFARLQAAHGVLSMHAIGEHNVDDVDFGIILDGIIVLVGVDVFRIYSVAERQFVSFVGMAAYQGYHLRLLALCEGRQYLMNGEAPQPDDRPTQLLAGGVGHNELRLSRLQQSARNIRCNQALSHLGDEASTRNLPAIRTRHGIHPVYFELRCFRISSSRRFKYSLYSCCNLGSLGAP